MNHKKWKFNTFLLALLIALLVGMSMPAAGDSSATTAQRDTALYKLHSLLLDLAQTNSDQMVPVIIQAQNSMDTLFSSINWADSVVTGELGFINAVSAVVPARDLLTIANSPAVKWISPDGPMVNTAVSAAVTIETVRDEFGTVSYENNDGSQNWAGGWMENDPESYNSSASTGQVRITGGQLSLDDYPDTGAQPSAARRVDLSNAQNATLSFHFATTAGVDKSDAVAVEVSYDGVSFSHLETFTGIEGSSSGSRTYDISGFRTATTTIRFRVSNMYGASSEQFLVDDVQIAYSVETASGTTPAPAPQTNPVFVTWSSEFGVSTKNNDWSNMQNILSPNGMRPDGLYGAGGKGKAAFAGFSASVTPGYQIGKVELLLSAYARRQIEDRKVKIKVYKGGSKQGEFELDSEIFDNYIGVGRAGVIAVDLTSSHNWQWGDFHNGLEIQIEHKGFKDKDNEYVEYDGIGLQVTAKAGEDDSLDGINSIEKLSREAFDISNLSQAFPFAVHAPETWNEAPAYLQGQKIAVAVVDSGVGDKIEDLNGRRVVNVNFNHSKQDGLDQYGHGTFVASILAGDGHQSKGEFTGIAPKVGLVNVRVSDDQGMSTEGDVLQALQWIFKHHENTNIRVVNLSLNSAVAQSYHTSPLAAGVEMLWLKGIVVVVSAGNNGSANLYPPANSPRVITVGAADDRGTPGLGDDVVAPFSAWGVDESGNVKPDLVAPGTNIIAYVPGNGKLEMGRRHKENAIDDKYFRMSGTSMSAPIVSGAVAMLLQDEPTLTPDQVKFRLKATANKSWPGYDPARAGAGYLDIYAAVHGTSLDNANQGLVPSELLRPVIAQMLGDGFLADSGFTWGSVNWNSVNWNSVNWNSVTWSSGFTWGSVNWNSVNWNSVNWNSVNWNSDFWDGSYFTTQSLRDRMAQPIPLPSDDVEEEEEIIQIFLPAIQVGNSQ
ncbi:MAG: S8 family peptidase [Caldilineaceae bacterium]